MSYPEDGVPNVSDLYDTIDPYSDLRQPAPVSGPELYAHVESGSKYLVLSEYENGDKASDFGNWISCANPVEIEE